MKTVVVDVPTRINIAVPNHWTSEETAKFLKSRYVFLNAAPKREGLGAHLLSVYVIDCTTEEVEKYD